jgi:hypothetical protein
MFYLSKVATLGHVLVTWLICWRDRSAPYFPIELSRTATGPVGKFYFPLGFLVVGYFFFVESAGVDLRWLWLSPLAGIFIAAVINDELHWQAHCAGVLLAAMGCFAKAAYETVHGLPNAVASQILCAMACVFFWMEMGLKVIAVLEEPLNWHCWWEACAKRRDEVVAQCMDINYHGTGTRAQLVMFRVSGVCQWAAVACLISTY